MVTTVARHFHLVPNQTIGNNASESHNVGKGYGEGVFRTRRKFVTPTNSRTSAALAVAILILTATTTSIATLLATNLRYSSNRHAVWHIAPTTGVFPSVFFQKANTPSKPLATITSLWGTSLGKAHFLIGLCRVRRTMAKTCAMPTLYWPIAAAQGSGATLHRRRWRPIADTDNLSGWIDVGYRFETGEMRGTVHFVAGYMESDRPTLAT